MLCPNSTEGGCRCPDHHPGLLAYSSDPTALAAALQPLVEQRQDAVTLRVLTSGSERPDNLVDIDALRVCDGSMMCKCENCAAELAAAVARGVRPSSGLPIKVRRAA